MNLSRLAALWAYLRRRLAERSTWASIAAGITGAALLAQPYSWLAIAAAVIGALVPEPTILPAAAKGEGAGPAAADPPEPGN